MPENNYFESCKVEGKYWRARVEELTDSLNDLGLFIPELFLDKVS